jgi:uncharacterized protein YegP (UPF0339 family)
MPKRKLPHGFHLYRSPHNWLWRWRLVSKNGRVIADGAEGYTRKTEILKAVNRVIELSRLADIHLEESPKRKP